GRGEPTLLIEPFHAGVCQSRSSPVAGRRGRVLQSSVWMKPSRSSPAMEGRRRSCGERATTRPISCDPRRPWRTGAARHPNPTVQNMVRPFVHWCIAQRRMPRLRLPPTARTSGHAIIQPQRLALVRRVLTEPDIPDVDRVVALLILRYAQPLHRIAQLTVDDVLVDSEDMLLRL